MSVFIYYKISMQKYKTIGTITVQGVGKMHKTGRRQIARWLRGAAEEIEHAGHLITKGRYTAKYYAPSKAK